LRPIQALGSAQNPRDRCAFRENSLETGTGNLDPVTGNCNSLIGVRTGTDGAIQSDLTSSWRHRESMIQSAIGNPTARVQHRERSMSESPGLSCIRRSGSADDDLAEEFGVSGRGLAEICRCLDVPVPPRVIGQRFKIVRCRPWWPRCDLFLTRLPVPQPGGFGPRGRGPSSTVKRDHQTVEKLEGYRRDYELIAASCDVLICGLLL